MNNDKQASDTSFKHYYANDVGRKHEPFVENSLRFCTNFGTALDLGAGSLIESSFLTSRFEKVIAVDRNPVLLEFQEKINNKKIECVVADFKDATFPEQSFDYICSIMSLPFFGKIGFEDLIIKVVSWMKQDAIFAFNLFGDRHDLNTGLSPKKFMSESEINKLACELNLELLLLKEFEYVIPYGPGKISTKFHTFNVIVKKK